MIKEGETFRRERRMTAGARKESEQRAVYAGQYYRAIPSEMPRLRPLRHVTLQTVDNEAIVAA